jgi:hypothetical protein
MRIRELLEGKKFNDLNFITKTEDGRTDIAYDLVEDLVFYLNNNDDLYRRHLYPVISNCVESMNSNKEPSPNVFKKVVEQAYKNYIKEFPIRQLPHTIEEQTCNEVCQKMHEEFCKNFQEGKYKD